MMPVIPPMTKITRKPTTNRNGVRHTGLPAQMVATHTAIWTPAGMPIAMLAPAKNDRISGDSPTVNMWCAHNPKDRKPIATNAPTIQVYPTMRCRTNTGTIIETTPVAGMNWMYTSGWPKIQNRCCHSSELPPRSTSKKAVSKPRSSSSSRSPMTSGVKPNRIMNAITSTAQANSGMRLRVMPGVRIFSTPMMISIAAAMAPISATASPITQKSMPLSGENSAVLSGVSANQPAFGTSWNRVLE